MHERYRQTDRRQTDGRRHSERERMFTFANKIKIITAKRWMILMIALVPIETRLEEKLTYEL